MATRTHILAQAAKIFRRAGAKCYVSGEDPLSDEVPMTADDVRAEADGPPQGVTRREEFVAFLTLAVLIWPVLAVGIVGGYGFLVWMYQLVFGPPDRRIERRNGRGHRP